MQVKKIIQSILLYIFLFFLISNRTVSANSFKTIIAVDASTSMRGFFTTGEIYNLINLLKSAIDYSDINIYCYKYNLVNGEPFGSEHRFNESLNANGQITLLNKCFKCILKNNNNASIVYLITDNVQDPEGSEEEQGDIEKYYAQLRSNQVIDVYIFPLQLNFNGPLFKRDGSTRLTDRYTGKRGLVIYSILLKNGAKDIYLKQNSKFGNLINFNGIPAKLIEGETVSAFPVDLELTNYEISERNKLILKEGELVPLNDRPFSEGEPIIGFFTIGIKSKLNYVIIDRSKVKVELYENFKFFGLGTESSDFRADRPVVRWDPMVLEHAIISGNFEVGRSPKVKIELRFDKGVRFSKSLGALFRYMKKDKAGDFRGKLVVKLGVESSNFHLFDEVINKYSISNQQYFEIAREDVQSRILNLDKLFKQTYTYSDILAEKYPIHFRVNYPSWPIFLFIFLIFLFIAIILFLLNRRIEYQLIDLGKGKYQFEIAKGIVCEDLYNHDYPDFHFDDVISAKKFKLLPFIGGYSIFLDGIRAARIKYIPIYGIVILARKNFVINEDKKVKHIDPFSETQFIINEKITKQQILNLDLDSFQRINNEIPNSNKNDSNRIIKSSKKNQKPSIDQNYFKDYPEY